MDIGRMNESSCQSCGMGGATIQCGRCSRSFHPLCVPARTTRSGQHALCLECSKATSVAPPLSAPMSLGGSLRSVSSTVERERLQLVRRRLQVRKQLLELDRADEQQRTPVVTPCSGNVAESLRPPNFHPIGIVKGRNSLMGSITPQIVVVQGPCGEVTHRNSPSALNLFLESGSKTTHFFDNL